MTKLEILQKPIWTAKYISSYMGVSLRKAYDYFNSAKKKKDGSVIYDKRFCKADAVLAIFGTTREKELTLYALSQKTSQN